ncbi:MAG: hypothetical protein PHX83_13300 [Acidobacteriia bacterium]|nr:hypothetical protein [Terriglobia bacterium]
MKKVSWILLVVVGVLTLIASLGSVYVALNQAPDGLVGPNQTLVDVPGAPAQVVRNISARRLTAASYAAAFSLLFLAVVWFPYRRGEVWSWWTILVTALLLVLLTSARVPALGTSSGVVAALIQFGLIVIALLFDVKRLRKA